MLPQSLPGDIRCSDTFKSRFPTQNPGKAPCLAHTDRLDGNQRPLVPRFGSFFPQNPHAHFEVPISVEIILRGCRDNDGLGGSARRFLRGLCIYQGTTAQSQFQNHPKLPLCTQLEAQIWKKNSCFPSPRAAQVPPCFWDGNSPKKSRNVEPIHRKSKQQFGINKCEWSFPAGKEDRCFGKQRSPGSSHTFLCFLQARFLADSIHEFRNVAGGFPHGNHRFPQLEEREGKHGGTQGFLHQTQRHVPGKPHGRNHP